MKKLMIILAITLMVSAGCSKQETPTEKSLIDSNSSQIENTEEAEDKTEENEVDAEEEASSEETASKEEVIIPQAELDASLSKKNSIDIKSSDADVEEISLEPESESWEPRILKEFTEDGEILKLTVTEPTDAGKMTGLTTFYYDEGELFFIESSFANYVFKNGKLIIWADENHNILDMTDTDLERRQEVLVDYLVNYLEMFNQNEK